MAKIAFTAAQFAEANKINEDMILMAATLATLPEAEAIETDFTDAEAIRMEAEDDAVIEALETEASAEVVLDVQAPQGTFDEILMSVSDQDAIDMALKIVSEVDERSAFEKVSGNDNIQKALDKSRKQLGTPTAARVMIACSVDPSMINRSVHEGKRYNVYALGKLSDAIYGLVNGSVNNAINVACMKSLFRFKAAGKDFTGEMAKAAASDKIKVDIGLRGLLVRHTVSASTSSTQASSTMQALVTLGIVSKAGSHKNPTFTLIDGPIVDRLRTVLGEAAPVVAEEAIAA